MGIGLVLYDAIYFALATALYAGALGVAAQVFTRLSSVVPWPVAVVPALVVALLTLIAEVGVLTLLCPRLKPGKVQMMKGATFYGWMLRSLLRRCLMMPGVRWPIFTSNVLRFLALRAMGAKVAFTANMSGDVDVLDPSLLVVEPGATIGAKCFLSGHYVEGRRLLLGTVTVRAGALLAADVTVGPDTEIGAGAVVKPGTAIGPGVRIGEKADIGGQATIDVGVHVGARAKIGHRVLLAAGCRVGDGERVAAGETRRRK